MVTSGGSSHPSLRRRVAASQIEEHSNARRPTSCTRARLQPTLASVTDYETHENFISDALLADLLPLFECAFGPAPPDYAERVRLCPRLLLLVARSGGRAVGYKLGYARELDVFYSWLGGVHPDFRQRGIARELLERQHRWCASHGFRQVLTETRTPFKAMLILNLKQGFDVVGFSLDPGGQPSVLLSKTLATDSDR